MIVTRYLGAGGPYLAAHRGGAGIGRENVLATFVRSFELGVHYLETDVRITADGVCVAFHDATLSRITGVAAKVSDLTLAQVRTLGIGGECIPRIEDLLDALPEARFIIDLKDSRALAPLIGILRRRGDLDRVALAGARDRWLSAARAMAGSALTTTLGWESTTRLVMAARTGRLPQSLIRAEFVHVPWRLGRAQVFNERLVAMAHQLGLKVTVWTVDDVDVMRRLLGQGADGIISDRPDMVLRIPDAQQTSELQTSDPQSSGQGLSGLVSPRSSSSTSGACSRTMIGPTPAGREPRVPSETSTITVNASGTVHAAG
jgi:glycerophosphoryl diester phosphodiesterase